MPFVDKTYGRCVRPLPSTVLPDAERQELLSALCEARDALAAMEWEGEENWRHWDATRLDELIAGTLRVVNAALTKAGGSDASA